MARVYGEEDVSELKLVFRQSNRIAPLQAVQPSIQAVPKREE